MRIARKNQPATPIERIEDEAKMLKKEYGRLRKFTDENTLIVSVILFGIVALVIINTLYWVSVTNNVAYERSQRQMASLTPHVTTSLETANNGQVEVTVKNVTTNSDADPAFGVASDQTMLIMDMTVKNTSGATQQFIPASQLYVRSREGDYSQLHASMHVKNPIAMQQLQPGESITGQVSFAVYKRIDTPLVYVDTGWNASLPVAIDVQH